MPGSLVHLNFAEIVYSILSAKMPLDKIEFMSSNLIPDLAVADKKITHYRKQATIPELFAPDMERVRNDLLDLENPIKLGMFCHLYLDFHFIEGFLIPEFVWDRPRMKIVNPRNKQEWDPEPFFRKGGVYYTAFSEINQKILENGCIMQTINELPNELPNTGIKVFDVRQEKNWKTEMEEYIANKKEYTSDVFDYERLVSFIEKTAIQLTQEILTEYKE